MPFKKITHGKDKGKYRHGKKGKPYTLRQMRAYYATKGWKRTPKKRR